MSTTPHRRSPTRDHHRRAVLRSIREMHGRIDEHLTLEDLARAAYASPFHFNRIFHREVGLPPGHFLSALRMETAKRLLLQTGQKVIDICLNVGFSSPGTFSRRFRDMTGLSPHHMRRLDRELGDDKVERYTPHTAGRGRGVIHARLHVPPDFHGLVFAGLFPTPLPQSKPLACAVLVRPARFRISGAPEGEHYLLAVGVPLRISPRQLLMPETALRGGSTSRPVVIRNGRCDHEPEIILRPPRPTDPPILITLPWEARRAAARDGAPGAS